ncbi:MAG: TIGR02302 family protein [Alphaproteobacteria bacterium]
MLKIFRSENRLALRMRLARAALLWERVWPASWPALCVLGVFAAVALLDLLPGLPGLAHAAILALFAVAFAASVVWGLRAARRGGWPDTLAARRRIEQASGLPHRPLQALDDHPSAPLDDNAKLLWAAHQRRMAAALRRLRVGWPIAGLARRDPWGIRSVLAILLLLAVIDAGTDWRDRAFRAVQPSFAASAAALPTSFELWVSPPEYTGLAPQFLRADVTGTAPVATGSVLLGQVHGGGEVPLLAIDETREAFAAVDKQNFRIERKLTNGKELSLHQGGNLLGRWGIEIVPDNPPTIAFAEPPAATARAALRLALRAADDYGLASAKAMIRLPESAADETIELDLPLPGLSLKEAEAASYHDLTPHPWAGLPVEIRLVATDGLGQTGESEPVRTTLPEREFQHPVARAIIDQRKELAKDPRSAAAVAEILGDLNSRPALFRDDTVVYLGVRMAQQRLRSDSSKESIAAVSQLLWDTALRIEDGNLSLAERDLRRLQQKLQEALAKGAPDEEIERLMQELRDALDRYLQAMAEEMRRRPPQEATQPIDPSQMLTRRDLQQMLDRAREMARSGARDQARELLSQLQEMLENLRTAQPGQMQQQGEGQAQQMMRGLQQLMQRQQQLLDRSFRARSKQGEAGESDRNGQPQTGEQQGAQGEAGEMGEMGDAAGQQEALRRMLGEMMRQLGEGAGNIPEPFGRAERSMRDATGALGRARPGEAIGPQTDALDQLQQAARDLAQQFQNQLGSGFGKPDNSEVGATDNRPGRDRTERDPLGRPVSNNGTFDRGDVKIPDENILQKSRRILDELRRRAGERTRPEIELDYIERLLRRF